MKKGLIAGLVVGGVAVTGAAIGVGIGIENNKQYQVSIISELESAEFDGAGQYKVGQKVELSAAEVEGYRFAYWVLPNEEVNYENPYKFTLTKKNYGEYTAIYKLLHSVTFEEAANGSVGFKSPDMTNAIEGEEVELNITPEAHYAVSSLYYTVAGSDEHFEISMTNFTFTMPEADITIHATFDKIQYLAQVSEDVANGSVEIVPTTGVYGTVVQVSVIANVGYELDELYFVNEGETEHNEIDEETKQFELASNATVYAIFKAIDYSIEIPDNVIVLRGTEVLTSESKVHINDILTISYEETTGYHNTYFDIEGAILVSENTYIVGTNDVTIEYEEEINIYSLSFAEGEGYFFEMIEEEVELPDVQVLDAPGAPLTLPGIEVSEASEFEFEHGTEIKFILNIDDAYSKSTPIVKVNGTAIEDEDGVYTIVLTADTTITVEGVEINKYALTIENDTEYSFEIYNGEGELVTDLSSIVHGEVYTLKYPYIYDEEGDFEIYLATIVSGEEFYDYEWTGYDEDDEYCYEDITFYNDATIKVLQEQYYINVPSEHEGYSVFAFNGQLGEEGSNEVSNVSSYYGFSYEYNGKIVASGIDYDIGDYVDLNYLAINLDWGYEKSVPVVKIGDTVLTPVRVFDELNVADGDDEIPSVPSELGPVPILPNYNQITATKTYIYDIGSIREDGVVITVDGVEINKYSVTVENDTDYSFEIYNEEGELVTDLSNIVHGEIYTLKYSYFYDEEIGYEYYPAIIILGEYGEDYEWRGSGSDDEYYYDEIVFYNDVDIKVLQGEFIVEVPEELVGYSISTIDGEIVYGESESEEIDPYNGVIYGDVVDSSYDGYFASYVRANYLDYESGEYKDFLFAISVDDAYDESVPVVKLGDRTLTPVLICEKAQIREDAPEYLEFDRKTYIYNLGQVRENGLSITVDGIVKNQYQLIEDYSYEWESYAYELAYCPEDATGTFEVPSEYRGLPVISIGDYAFQNRDVNVILPSTIKNIGNFAFEGCTTDIDFSVLENLETIGAAAFARSGVTKVVLSQTVTNVGAFAFNACQALEEIEVYCEDAYFESSYYDDETGDNYNGYYTFANCPNLKKVYWGNAVFDSEDGLFSNSGTNAENGIEFTIAGNIEGIRGLIAHDPSYCYEEVPNVTKLIIEADTTRTGIFGRYNYGSNTGIKLDEMIVDSQMAFDWMKTHAYFTIDENGAYSQKFYIKADLEGVDETDKIGAMYNYNNGGGISWYASKQATSDREGYVLYVVDTTPASELEFEDVTGGVKITGYTGSSSIVVIGEEYDGKTVVEIGDNAFQDKDVSVTLPATITKIGDYAFENCSTNIDLTDLPNLESIGFAAFAKSGVKKVVLGDNITHVGPFAFNGCEDLKEVECYITDNNAFEKDYYGSQYDDVYPSVYYTFANCPNLEKVYWASNASIYDGSLFSGSGENAYSYGYVGGNWTSYQGIVFTFAGNVTSTNSILGIDSYYISADVPKIAKVIFEEDTTRTDFNLDSSIDTIDLIEEVYIDSQVIFDYLAQSQYGAITVMFSKDGFVGNLYSNKLYIKEDLEGVAETDEIYAYCQSNQPGLLISVHAEKQEYSDKEGYALYTYVFEGKTNYDPYSGGYVM